MSQVSGKSLASAFLFVVGIMVADFFVLILVFYIVHSIYEKLYNDVTKIVVFSMVVTALIMGVIVLGEIIWAVLRARKGSRAAREQEKQQHVEQPPQPPLSPQ